MHLTLEMLLPLAGILAGTRLAAVASQRIGLPAVFGELCLGFLVGPAVLNWLHPSETMNFIADIGVILLMFMAGLETDLLSFKRVGKPSFLAAAGGVILPLAGGYGLGIAFGLPAVQALFLGAVLTATSVSVSAQTLRELGKLRSPEGATTISAALIDDILGVILFAGVMSLNSGGNLGLTIGRMALFLPAAWFVGNWLLPRIIKLERHMKHHEATLAVIVALLLVYAWAAEALGSVATITGAYILGVVVSRHVDQRHPIHAGSSALGYGLFIPVFFVNIGLQANLDGLTTAPLLTVSLVVFAVLSKVVGSGFGARIGGLSGWSSLQVGVSMVSRGEVALVIAGAGLAGGLLDSTIFSALIIVTLVTTLITPPLLRLVSIPLPLHNRPEPISLPTPAEPRYEYILDKQV
jgi:Kef-type K+ transport system membrane component KefB